MRPLHLEMQGFGAFRSATAIDFTDIDLLALIGDTGSGKSTVIDAITFALYGSIARYDDNRAVAPAINQTSNQARVRLDFELSGETYTAVRVVRRTKAGATTKEARLERAGEILASDARGMSAAVGDLLGLDVDQFNRTVVLPQGRFADFLHDKPAQRQETLRHLLGLELYQRIGRRAREDATSARVQIEVLKPGLAASEGVTDERRRQLTGQIRSLDAAERQFSGFRDEIAELERQIAELDGQLATKRAKQSQLQSVRAPDDIDLIEQEITDARDQLAAADSAAQKARELRRKAIQAVRDGPDITTVTMQRQGHETVASLAGEAEDTSDQLRKAQSDMEEAAELAGAVRVEQERLDAAVTAARETEGTARSALTGVRSIGEIDQLLRLHEQRARESDEVTKTEQAVAAAAEKLQPAEEAVVVSAANEAEARRVRDELRQRAGAAGLVNLLAIGDPCPLCLQRVQQIPRHHIDDDVAAAEGRLTSAESAMRLAVEKRDKLRSEQGSREGALNAVRRSLRQLDEHLAGVSSVEVLSAERASVVALATAVDEAADELRRAVEASEEHRESAACREALEREASAREQVVGLAATAEVVAERLLNARAQLEGLPSAAELDQSLERAQSLRAEHDRALADCDEKEKQLEKQAGHLEAVSARVQHVRRDLEAIRDGVADLRPPPLAGNSLAEDWTALTKWAGSAANTLDMSISQDEREQADRSDRRNDCDRNARRLCTEVLDTDASTESLTGLTALLTRGQADAQNELKVFDADRARLTALQQQIETLEERAAVAETLANLLRADGFERWLMGAALRRLVAAATVRLFELSGGQYSLELNDRSFDVRDHTNADELRSTRSLSGGETFLASLSLALALADATAELAPEGAPQLESIFLDEGFGTLDPQTLDTVANAIEELGATGRLVGIITHIRDLADRMPVRLEVRKLGGSSSVERIEV